MGWKLFCVIIKNDSKVEEAEVLRQIGFQKIEKIGRSSPETAFYPDENEVHSGVVGDCRLIFSQGLPEDFIGGMELSLTEEKLIEMFPNGSILAAVLHSGNNTYGYALIENGKKVRLKAGHADRAVVMDEGEPLEEEKNLLEAATTDEQGDRWFHFEGSDEPYPEHAVGEDFVFSVMQRFLGQRPDGENDYMESEFLTSYKVDFSLDDDADTGDDESEETEEETAEGGGMSWLTILLAAAIIGAIVGVIFFF